MKRVDIIRSTGDRRLDDAAVTALRKWQFKPGALPLDPELVHDAFAKEDYIIRVPISFVLARNGVITKT